VDRIADAALFETLKALTEAAGAMLQDPVVAESTRIEVEARVLAACRLLQHLPKGRAHHALLMLTEAAHNAIVHPRTGPTDEALREAVLLASDILDVETEPTLPRPRPTRF
jgi:hypothetical protein